MNIVFDAVTKHRYLVYLRGFVRNEDGVRRELRSVEAWDRNGRATASTHQRPLQQDPHTAFECYLKFDTIVDMQSLVLEALLEGEKTPVRLAYPDVRRRTLRPGSYTIDATWAKLMESKDIRSVVDIGGRARSGVSRKNNYFDKEVTVVDIVSAPDVDFVADAHDLGAALDEGRMFDAFISIATFEHLIMPWKAAIEINRILKPGGVGLVVSHQTLGLHEVPWDFYRYSDVGWRGIFNVATGFEVLDSGLSKRAMILPLEWAAQSDNAEGAVGYLQSGVVVRKTGEPLVSWPVATADLIDSHYPQ